MAKKDTKQPFNARAFRECLARNNGAGCAWIGTSNLVQHPDTPIEEVR